VTAARRTDAGTAVAGLFARSTATGGLATREPVTPRPATRSSTTLIRQGVELPEDDVEYLRGLARPDRTGQRRAHGSKFVATGLTLAAVELLRDGDIDMEGVEAGDLETMKARARAALIRAGTKRADQEA